MDFYHRPHRLLLDKRVDLQHKNGSSRIIRHGYGNEASFDTNMVVILASLLCALICALGLNSILRCAMRFSRRFSFAEEEEVAGGGGVKRSRLREIPVAVYGSGVDIPATDCPICLGEFVDGEKVRVLPKCRHGFHVRCIDRWLASHSSCPTCRRSLLDQPAPSDAQDAAAAISSGAHATMPAGAAGDDAG
ncbi:PREDICTED: RING-H2 finger protein ATL74-like [Ipomoea nil]|uniref:RING-H2 finger protein ATL74-like n=1 Tax=Ipomoea nil TaxID=35883 RepID=UPI000901C958|nr:PREDICTED: RING-H2 finger protein ATL74-like [Ipomoea nil]XP_019192122.1 PREDICTED: RING-H2 finger protein ATL74-like [Ipomoea nil]